MATPSVTWQDRFSTTLSSGVTATDTTIPLVSLPTGSEGYLILEPDSTTAFETVYFTSKTGSAVVCPSVAAGRGVGGTASSHSSGATVRMDTTAQMFNALQDGTGLTGLHTWTSAGSFDYVASGCIWSADAPGSTRAASMSSGVVYINGRRHTVGAVTARTFTASKDTYVDLLYSTVDNIATPVYTEVNNNAASPALASNSVRAAVIITGAGNIAGGGSINQGEEGKILPIASSIPYAVTDSLGNLICPRDPNRRVLGYRQILTNFTLSSSQATPTQVTGLTCPVIVPTGRKVRVSFYAGSVQPASGISQISVWDGVVNVGTEIATSNMSTTNNSNTTEALVTPASTSKTYNAGVNSGSAVNTTVGASAVQPAWIRVDLV